MDHSHHHGHNMDMGSVNQNVYEPAEHRGIHDSEGTPISDHDAQHGDHVNSDPSLHAMMMSMSFHFGTDETILFSFWKTSEAGTLFASMTVIFLLAFLYEALKFYREHLYRKSFRTIQYNTVTVPVENGGTVKETQKTVQIAPQNISVDPDFEHIEITPIFISQAGPSCSCPGASKSHANADCESLSKVEVDAGIGSVPQFNNNSQSRQMQAPCNMNSRNCSTTISTNIRTAYKVKMISWMHTWQTILHVLQVILSYFLMLIFMTYNVWLCLAVVLGAGTGYFFFGWKKSLVVDITEHCH